MVFETPISWLLVEIFSIILFFICLNHASKQENSIFYILELFGFVLGAGLFENVGVNISHTYYYDTRRIMMIGSVPLEILFIEAATWYAAINLALKLNFPKWAIPFVVGLLGSVQDMTVDPAAVFDTYAITDQAIADAVNTSHPEALGNGIQSGQWNWTNPGYDGGFFGIPVFNFSGWMYLMAFYTIFVLIGRWLYQKYSYAAIGFLYPFVAGVMNVVCLGTPLNRLLLFGNLDPTQSTIISETIMLCLNYGFAIALLIIFRKRASKINLKQDGYILFLLPIAMHLYDIIYAFVQQVEIAYIPVILISSIHFAYLFIVYQNNKRIDNTILFT